MTHRTTVIIPSLVAACLAALPLRADAPSPTEQALARENAELKSQVAALRKQVSLLNAELIDQKIKFQAGQLRLTTTTRPTTLVVPPPSDLPPRPPPPRPPPRRARRPRPPPVQRRPGLRHPPEPRAHPPRNRSPLTPPT